MKNFLQSFLLLSLIILSLSVKGQNILKGVLLDSTTREPVYGATVAMIGQESLGVTTDNDGYFALTISYLPASIRVAAIGYNQKIIRIEKITSITDTIWLLSEGLSLNEVVITSGKHEQQLERVPMSVEIVSRELVTETQTTNVNEVLEKVPGVQVQKDQVTIRGGSGFSYGAGSRIMVLLDEMPLLSADASDAKWAYFPLENLEQIEIIKGASSSLYGSSAIEGVIHLRTAMGSDTTYTQVRQFGGLYDYPKREETSYWEKSPPGRRGFSFAHRRNIGRLQSTVSIYGLGDDGFRKDDNEELLRGNLRLQYRPPSTEKWILGGGISGMVVDGVNFIMFGDKDKPYHPLPGSASGYTNSRWHADGSIKYYPNANVRHIIRTRYYTTVNTNDARQNSTGRILYSEYQYQQTLLKRADADGILTGGLSHTLTQTLSPNLYGTHSGNNIGAYAQTDFTLGKLNLTFGGRIERNKIDTFDQKIVPVVRMGANYQLFKGTFIRTAAGQGFRYPSVAELFAQTTTGAIRIFPNVFLKPETGLSGEIGVKQLLVNKKIKGYMDATAFWARYREMIEYTFGFYPPPGFNPLTDTATKYLGFKAKNIPETVVKGLDLTTGFQTTPGAWDIKLYGGYNFLLPFDEQFRDKDTSERLKFLKYRRQHSIRANFDLKYKHLGIGLYSVYNSSFRNIDQFFIDVITGLKPGDFWINYSEGWVTDLRFTITVNRSTDISFYVKNLLNEEYMEMPGNTNPTRSFNLQLVSQF